MQMSVTMSFSITVMTGSVLLCLLLTASALRLPERRRSVSQHTSPVRRNDISSRGSDILSVTRLEKRVEVSGPYILVEHKQKGLGVCIQAQFSSTVTSLTVLVDVWRPPLHSDFRILPTKEEECENRDFVFVKTREGTNTLEKVVLLYTDTTAVSFGRPETRPLSIPLGFDGSVRSVIMCIAQWSKEISGVQSLTSIPGTVKLDNGRESLPLSHLGHEAMRVFTLNLFSITMVSRNQSPPLVFLPDMKADLSREQLQTHSVEVVGTVLALLLREGDTKPAFELDPPLLHRLLHPQSEFSDALLQKSLLYDTFRRGIEEENDWMEKWNEKLRIDLQDYKSMDGEQEQLLGFTKAAYETLLSSENPLFVQLSAPFTPEARTLIHEHRTSE